MALPFSRLFVKIQLPQQYRLSDNTMNLGPSRAIVAVVVNTVTVGWLVSFGEALPCQKENGMRRMAAIRIPLFRDHIIDSTIQFNRMVGQVGAISRGDRNGQNRPVLSLSSGNASRCCQYGIAYS